MRLFSLAKIATRYVTMSTSRLSTAVESTPTFAEANKYVPPKVWTWNEDPKSLNRPTAGARFDQKLPVGEHPLQLYSMATPNGQKVTIMLEELREAGIPAEYDAWLIKIMDQDQFGSDFVSINPNSKIPAMVDYTDRDRPLRIFESGSILLHLAEKFDGAFLPADKRTEVLNWLFWQVGSAPFLGGGFGHWYAYKAGEKEKYPIDRFTMETKRQLDVLNQCLAENRFVAGDEYTIADIAVFPWYGGVVLGQLYGDAATFLNVNQDYPHVIRWAEEISQRPAVQRGRMVNRTWGDDPKLEERHDASDFEEILREQSPRDLAQ